MQAFLVGRQVLVAMMMVLLGRVTTYAGDDGELCIITYMYTIYIARWSQY